MKKIFNLLLITFIFLQFIFVTPNLAIAAPACSLTTIPTTITPNDKSIDITIGTPGLVSNEDYSILFWNSRGEKILVYDYSRQAKLFKADASGSIALKNFGNSGGLNNSVQDNFKTGTYRLRITDTNQNADYCDASFTVGGACQIIITSKRTNDTDLVIKVENLKANPDDAKQVVIKRKPENNDVYIHDQKVQLLTSGLTVGKLVAGDYTIEIKNIAFLNNFGNDQQCQGQFTIFTPGTEPPTEDNNITIPPFTPTPEAFLNPVCDKDGSNTCSTALGPISTDPAGFVKSAFGILLSLAGGIALVLIMISGYRLMVSQGNPEKVQAAREQLTSAIVGLLFIIFSITILQVIGVNILNLPGFTK